VPGTLGAGSVAEGEYMRNMSDARIVDGLVRWVEICYCPVPLQEERPDWEQYFELMRIQDAHNNASAETRTARNRGPVASATAQTA
jgi:hypothetical protein